MLILALLFACAPARASDNAHAPIAFVPLDDRPVTYQLPTMLGAIAGVPVVTPPRVLLGHYLDAGDPEAIMRWLRSDATQGVQAVVASTDMVAYGGLVNSRVNGISTSIAISRLRDLAALRALRQQAWVSAFGTVMRLAPTGVPQRGPGSEWFAPGQTGALLTEWANLPQGTSDPRIQASSDSLRARIGEPVVTAYLKTRARNRDVDLVFLQLAAEGNFDRVVLGQDDAGKVGLHVADVEALRAAARRFRLGDRASIEPGADELGMALVAQALARAADWQPRVALRYSRAEGAAFNDPLEFEPIGNTLRSLIELCGGREVDGPADIVAFVRLPHTGGDDERAFHRALFAAVRAGTSVAVIDLSFLNEHSSEPERTTQALITSGLAAKIDAFASWNTTANTAGTALAEAIAAGAGRRLKTYDPIAHAQFMLDRYADDYAFHVMVRPQLNAQLDAAGVADHTYLSGRPLAVSDALDRHLLWPDALDLLAQIYPQYGDAGLTISLPWNRTFETELDVRLRPKT